MIKDDPRKEILKIDYFQEGSNEQKTIVVTEWMLLDFLYGEFGHLDEFYISKGKDL